ncbi:MAG: M20/M25/M40 family metallo-hydrolase [Bacteriovoracaceae bacterium]|nr:M20/M25/M40 family metallo-hydrolase [Bacteriovoracaceae bacterium]
MLLFIFSFMISSPFSHATPVMVSASDLNSLPKSIIQTTPIKFVGPSTVELDLNDEEITLLAQHFHKLKGRCGGFVTGASVNETHKSFSSATIPSELKRQPEVLNLIPQVEESRMSDTIKWFSSYPTRFYLTDEGKQAMEDLAKKWRDLTKDLPNAEVTLFQHKDWAQPTVVLKIKGLSPEEIILGGHGDSINTDTNDIHAPAPGADDNASGISVLTEIIRVLAKNKYQPKSTLTFMAYSAEEVGLRGSMDVSAYYLDQGIPVKGVLQFDGTNFKGSQELGMILVEDLTSPSLNNLMEKLINTYLKLPWAYDRCGYACSDHYSWTFRGFASTFPFESRLNEENSHIHTPGDLFSVSGNNAHHAVPFARLGLAYALEMDQ